MPQFESVTVNGGVTGRCTVTIEYQRITNDTGNAVFQKINSANRVAIINDKANAAWNVNQVRFGWFDFIDDMEVSAALLDAVTEFEQIHAWIQQQNDAGNLPEFPEGETPHEIFVLPNESGYAVAQDLSSAKYMLQFQIEYMKG